MKIAFIGTNFGLSPEQINGVRKIILHYKPEEIKLGYSKGSDYIIRHIVDSLYNVCSISDIDQENPTLNTNMFVMISPKNRYGISDPLLLMAQKKLGMNNKIIIINPSGEMYKENGQGKRKSIAKCSI